MPALLSTDDGPEQRHCCCRRSSAQHWHGLLCLLTGQAVPVLQANNWITLFNLRSLQGQAGSVDSEHADAREKHRD